MRELCPLETTELLHTWIHREYDSIHQPHEVQTRTNPSMERGHGHEISLLAVGLLAIDNCCR